MSIERREMMDNFLLRANILVCECGILLQLDKLFQEQYDFNAKNQHYYCPICKREIKGDSDG